MTKFFHRLPSIRCQSKVELRAICIDYCPQWTHNQRIERILSRDVGGEGEKQVKSVTCLTELISIQVNKKRSWATHYTVLKTISYGSRLFLNGRIDWGWLKTNPCYPATAPTSIGVCWRRCCRVA